MLKFAKIQEVVTSVPSENRNFIVWFGYTVTFATVYKGNIIKNLIMDCQSYTKYRPNETTLNFISWFWRFCVLPLLLLLFLVSIRAEPIASCAVQSMAG